MNPILLDMYGHQAWADAEHWRTIGAHETAREDQAIRNRLHHIHLVQRVFRWVVGDRKAEFALTTPADFKSFDELMTYARSYHEEMRRFLDSMSESRLTETVTIPYAPKGAPTTLTVTEALTQGAMHSHYHRGQNATRLRELGGAPPTTDLIVWYWNGRKEPEWGG